MTQGYASPFYTASYSEFGEPTHFPVSGAQFLRRQINTELHDFTGVYPFVTAKDWPALAGELEDLRTEGAVSAVFVTDPFASDNIATLEGTLDVLRKFKCHYVVDLSGDWRSAIRKTTRQYARRGLASGSFRIRDAQPSDASTFWALYQMSIERHGMVGLQAMSLSTIENQLAVPGALIAELESDAEIVCQMIMYRSGNILYPHLQGIKPIGYKNFASYAIFQGVLNWAASEGFAFVNLGGVAGLDQDPNDGLAIFKRGFSNDTRWTYLAGKILDHDIYRFLTKERPPIGFFPAYRNLANALPTAAKPS